MNIRYTFISKYSTVFLRKTVCKCVVILPEICYMYTYMLLMLMYLFCNRWNFFCQLPKKENFQIKSYTGNYHKLNCQNTSSTNVHGLSNVSVYLQISMICLRINIIEILIKKFIQLRKYIKMHSVN